MKTREELAVDLQRLIDSHYYSEEFELVSALRHFQSELHDRERLHLEQVVLQRLADDGSIVDVVLCSVIIVPSASPLLVELLNWQTVANQMTRALIGALRHYDGDGAYIAVERFLDSDQEIEAAAALAAINFVRSLPLLFRLMRREQYFDVLLQILHDRRKMVGLDALIGELAGFNAIGKGDRRPDIGAVLQHKKPPYNPFSPNEIQRIIQAVGRS